MLLFTVTAYAAESSKNTIDVKATHLIALDSTATEWYSTDEYRGLFAVCMVMDCSSVWSEAERTVVAEALVLDTTYIVKDGNTINVFAFGQNDIMIFRYNCIGENAHYVMTVLEDAADNAELYMNALQKQGTFSSYYKVDSGEVLNVISELSK